MNTSQKYYFIDERKVGNAYRLKREVSQPEPYGDGPIIKNVHAYGTVLKDPKGFYRMWYLDYKRISHSMLQENDRYCYCEAYAVSDDGYHWTMPDLNIKPHEELYPSEMFSNGNEIIMPGIRDKNGFVLSGLSGPEGFCVIDNEQTPHPYARGRFTALYLSTLRISMDVYAPGGLCFAHSEDGINWTAYPENPMIEGWMDSQSTFFYDDNSKKYVLYARPNVIAMDKLEANRYVVRYESDDLVKWTPHTKVLETDDLDGDPFVFTNENEVQNQWLKEAGMPIKPLRENKGFRGRNRQFYGLSAFPYQDIFLGFAQIEDIPTGECFIELVHSYDTKTWIREALRKPFIPTRPGKWDAGMTISAMSTEPLLIDDKLLIYHTGRPNTHVQPEELFEEEGGIGIRTLVRDRYVGYTAGGLTGGLLTGAFDTPKEIYINACFKDKTKINIQAIGANGENIEGFEHGRAADCNDTVLKKIVFDNDKALGNIGHEQIRLRIHYTNATIFGLEFIK
jgi:hypothetical protein